MTKNLGCTYGPTYLITNFTINNVQHIVILPDPSHMIKLVRNCFGEKKRFVDDNDEIVDYMHLLKNCWCYKKTKTAIYQIS